MMAGRVYVTYTHHTNTISLLAAAVDEKSGFKTKKPDKTEGIWFEGFYF